MKQCEKCKTINGQLWQIDVIAPKGVYYLCDSCLQNLKAGWETSKYASIILLRKAMEEEKNES